MFVAIYDTRVVRRIFCIQAHGSAAPLREHCRFVPGAIFVPRKSPAFAEEGSGKMVVRLLVVSDNIGRKRTSSSRKKYCRHGRGHWKLITVRPRLKRLKEGKDHQKSPTETTLPPAEPFRGSSILCQQKPKARLLINHGGRKK